MTYYGGSLVTATSPPYPEEMGGLEFSTTGPFFRKEDLVRQTDGRCGSWQELMISTLGVQNVSAYPVSVVPQNGVIETTEGTVSLRGLMFIYRGLPGQNSTNPQYIFSDHALVRHNGSLYDPSYARSYTGASPDKEWETASLEKVRYRNPADGREYWVFKQSDSPNDLMCNFN